MLMGSYQTYPYKKRQVIDGITILHDDFVKKQDRYVVEFECRCGKIDYKRLWHLNKMAYKVCKYCSRTNKYPEQRMVRDFQEYELHRKWLSAIQDSLTRGKKVLECSVDLKDLREQLDKQNSTCPYTGRVLLVKNMFKKDSNASIDRIDSSKGYIYGNVEWVYKPINIIKNGLSKEDFISICKEVSNFI